MLRWIVLSNKLFEISSKVIEILWDQITFDEYNEFTWVYIDIMQEMQVISDSFVDFQG